MPVTDQNDIVLIDHILDHIDTAGCNAHIAPNKLALFAGYQHLAVGRRDDITVADTHIGQILHTKLLKITLGKIRNRHDTHEQTFTVGNRHRLQIMCPHDFAQMTQRIMLLDHDLAIHRDILDPRIQIGKKKRLFYLEMLQSKLCFRIDFPCTRRDDILSHRLLQMSIADRRTDRVGVRIAMANRVNGFRALHGKKIPPHILTGDCPSIHIITFYYTSTYRLSSSAS